jgi:hypothetical protein
VAQAEVTVEQMVLVGQFKDGAFDNSRLNFDQVAKKIIGARTFPDTPQGREFRR